MEQKDMAYLFVILYAVKHESSFSIIEFFLFLLLSYIYTHISHIIYIFGKITKSDLFQAKLCSPARLNKTNKLTDKVKWQASQNSSCGEFLPTAEG